MKTLFRILIDWWETPSPKRMQGLSNYVFPASVILGIFLVGGFHSLVGPYFNHGSTLSSFPWGRLGHGHPPDTALFASFRFLVGGGAWLLISYRWWRKKIHPAAEGKAGNDPERKDR